MDAGTQQCGQTVGEEFVCGDIAAVGACREFRLSDRCHCDEYDDYFGQ